MVDFLDVITINGINYVEISKEAIPDIEPRKYYISIYGKVYNRETGLFLQEFIKNGYIYISFKIRHKLYRTQSLHRLMMITFNYVPNYKQLQVDHINCDKLDDRLENFDWVSLEENTRRAYNNGLILMGEDCPWSKLTESQVREICELIASKQYNVTEISKMYNVSVTTIGDIARGKQWKHISKDYNLDYDLRDRFTDQEVHIICQIFQTYKPMGYSFDYMYYLILFYFGWPEIRRVKKRIARIYYKDSKSYKYIWEQYNY